MYSFCRILCENHVFGCENIVLSGVTCTNASDLALRLTVHMLQMILLYCISMPLNNYNLIYNGHPTQYLCFNRPVCKE